MTDDELSVKDVNQILYQTRNQERDGSRWPDPFRKEIQQAIESDADQVFIGGRMYNIHYEGTKFQLKPIRGFVPMGWFDRKWLDDPEN